MSNIFYKEKAKIALRNYSPNIFIMAAITFFLPMVISGVFNNGILGGGLTVTYNIETGESAIALFEQISAAIRESGLQFVIVLQIIYVLILSIMLEVISVLFRYGYTLFCLKASRGEQADLSDILAGFERPGRIIWAGILMDIKIFLWGLLLFFPAIAAALSYSQTYRVLIDDPNISASDAIAVSRDMMRGNRMNYFFLELSFFGWLLLEAFTGGISAVYSQPYIECACCAFYDDISGAYVLNANAEIREFDDYFEDYDE